MITFKLHEFTELPEDMIWTLPKYGPCDQAIDHLMHTNKISCSRQDAICFLKSYGLDLDPEDSTYELISKVLWIAIMDCRENQTTQFYMGE